MQAPILIVNTKTERESGKKAQFSNILAAKTVSDVIRSCLGPSSMLKMLMDPMGGIVLTNDGNAILREIEVAHPAAKSMIELSRAQDEEVGDGTTSVIILAGEILSLCYPFLDKHIHPIVIISGLRKALSDSLAIMKDLAVPIDLNNNEQMRQLVKASINTKFSGRWGDLLCDLALKAVRCVSVTDQDGHRDIDIKRFIRIEKIPGDEIEKSAVLDGVVLNKDITHPKMRRYIENPRIILLDCSLEYKKGESQTNLELLKESDWQRVLEIEEEQVKELCEKIISFKPDLVFTEKGVSDLAQHCFVKANITAIRRVRKTDNLRIAKAVGASIINRVEELKESDIGKECGLFRIDNIGDEYYTYLEKCKNPKACSILLRGASKDILNELERDLQDALCVARNLHYHPKIVPGGGAIEMAVAIKLNAKSKTLASSISSGHIDSDRIHLLSLSTGPYMAVAVALEVIPRTLISNCGGDVIRTLTQLKAHHAEGMHTFGVDGISGKLVDMATREGGGIWEPLVVKLQTLQTAVESACMLLRVDDIISGVSKKEKGHSSSPSPAASNEEGQNQ